SVELRTASQSVGPASRSVGAPEIADCSGCWPGDPAVALGCSGREPAAQPADAGPRAPASDDPHPWRRTIEPDSSDDAALGPPRFWGNRGSATTDERDSATGANCSRGPEHATADPGIARE